MKKLIIIFLIFFSIFYIYLLTCDEKIYYLSISNNYNSNDFSNIIAKKLKRNNLLEIHVNEFSNNNNRITDYIDMIDDNKYIIKNNKNRIFIGSYNIIYKVIETFLSFIFDLKLDRL